MNETDKSAFDPMPETPAEAQTPAPESSAAGAQTAELTAARKNMIFGLLWCVGGLAVTFGTYFLADEGGNFLIAHGAVIWGAIQAGKGLFTYLKIRYRNGQFAAFWRTATAALCVLLLVGYLSSLSLRLVRSADELFYVAAEQTYSCPEAGLEVRIPAGYTPIEQEEQPETDSTYARYFMYVMDSAGWEIGIETLQVGASRENLPDYKTRDSLLYDGGIMKATHPCTLNGRDMLYSAGRQQEYPGFVFSHYDFMQEGWHFSVGIYCPEDEYGKEPAQRRIEVLLGGITLTSEQ